MGILREKYTKEYFTGIDSQGNSAGYGATVETDENGVWVLRAHDRQILDCIDFNGQTVLDIGFGRGEAICYAYQHGALKCVGVDFSENAVELARQLFEKRSMPNADLYQMDASEFVDFYARQSPSDKFDIVIMLNIIENIPRNELKRILSDLTRITHPEVLFAVNTLAYKYDNDVVENGFDQRNLVNSTDTSDTVQQTKGMHCNKYSIISLQQFMDTCGVVNISEAHFFAFKKAFSDEASNVESLAYSERWRLASSLGVPFSSGYQEDSIEFPYRGEEKPRYQTFPSGLMAGLTLLITDQFQESVFRDGYYDQEIYATMQESLKEKTTIFDIGAYTGATSLLYAKVGGPRCEVCAFEPNPWNRNRMFLNLSKNPDYAGQIHVFPYAMSDENATAKMTVSTSIDNGYSSTSRMDPSHSKIRDGALPEDFFQIDVEAKTVDWFVRENRIVPDIIKIDVEGAEQNVLQGSVETINQYHPVFYIELHSEFSALACTVFLTNHNYNLDVLKEEEDNRIQVKSYPTNGKQVSQSPTSYDMILSNLLHQYDLTRKILASNEMVFQMLRSSSTVQENIIRNLQNELKKSQSEYQSIFVDQQRAQADYQALLSKQQDIESNYRALMAANQEQVSLNKDLDEKYHSLNTELQQIRIEHDHLLDDQLVHAASEKQLREDRDSLMQKSQALEQSLARLYTDFNAVQSEHEKMLSEFHDFYQSRTVQFSLKIKQILSPLIKKK